MDNYTSEDIRNIALVGHAGSGKTELTEALLLHSGTINSRGSLERGTMVCDFDPQEKTLGHSLDAALCHIEYQGKQITLIDTPGYPDLFSRSINVLTAVETVGVVINAQNGIEMISQRAMECASNRQLCRLIIINKIDSPDTDLGVLLNQIQESFGDECLPINLPAKNGTEVIDCFFNPASDATDISSVSAAHSELIDQVVEVDEKLMEIYLEQGEELDPKQLHDPFEKALREGHLIPVCFVSARTGSGIAELLDVIDRLMPNPSEGNPPQFLLGEGNDAQEIEVTPDQNRHSLAHVFKVNVDPYRGKLGVFRVHQGVITNNTQLYIGDGRKPFKTTHLLRLQGKGHSEIPQAVPGDICAVAKVEEIHYDAVLHDSHDEDFFHLRPMECTPPMLGIAVETTRRGDEQKLSDALHKLAAEDPTIRIEHNAITNETVIRGMGELHLRIVLETMKDRYNVEVKTHPPSIAYRETISIPTEGHSRHKKQTGGAGQFGEVFLKVEPLEHGAGFEFVNKIVGGAIPGQFIPAVEKGVKQVMDAGAIAGHPMQDIRVTVYDGKYHAVDSKEIAFVAAGKKAFLDAVNKAKPVILEPIVNIQITAPNQCMGDITGDLAGKRGRINGTSTRSSGNIVISSQVPLSELNSFQSTLKSITGGEGSYTMAFSHYEEVPASTQKELINAYKPHED